MSDPHALRHPLSATIRHLLDRISGLHREESTPPVNGPGTRSTRSTANR